MLREKKRLWVVVVAMGIVVGSCETVPDPDGTGGPYQATGLKIGEVTHDSVVVWTRATRGGQAGVPLAELDGWVKKTQQDFMTDLNWDDVFPEGSLEEDITVAQGEVGAEAREADGEKRLSKAERERILRMSAVEGINADVQLTYRAVDPAGPTVTTERYDIRDSRDYTRVIKLEGLRPDTKYEVVSMMYGKGSDVAGSTLDASFRTAPAPEAVRPVSFTVVTGQAYRNVDLRGEAFKGVSDASAHLMSMADPDEAFKLSKSVLGHRIFPVMAVLEPDFMVHTGDVVYYDHQGASAKSMRMARVWWQRMFALPVMRGFCRKVPIYFIKDDHDTLKNDCWPGQSSGSLSYAEGRRIFHEQTPLAVEGLFDGGEGAALSLNEGKPYRTVRWGKDLQIWLPETRDFRSPNDMDPENPRKTMLGEEQMEWLSRTLRESDATFKMVIFAIPVIGPDRPPEATEEEKDAMGVKKYFRPPRIDNLTNPTWHREREKLLTEVFAGVDNVILIVGDRHWKYHSAWPSKENPQIHEFSCGSTSDFHARTGLRMVGVPEAEGDPLMYWRDEIERGGFLSVVVKRDPRPEAIFRFHNTFGDPVYPANTNGVRQVRIEADGRSISAPVR
jgi:alkaline phosphatase D